MKILTVIPLERGLPKSDLTYFTEKNIEKGSIVEVPIRSRKILSLVVGSTDLQIAKADIKELDFNLRKINESKGLSIFRKEFIEAALDISHYFGTKENVCISALIPNIFKEKYDTISKFKNQTN